MRTAIVLMVVARWIKKDGPLKSRVLESVFCCAAVGFVLFLSYWNLLGWNY